MGEADHTEVRDVSSVSSAIRFYVDALDVPPALPVPDWERAGRRRKPKKGRVIGEFVRAGLVGVTAMVILVLLVSLRSPFRPPSDGPAANIPSPISTPGPASAPASVPGPSLTASASASSNPDQASPDLSKFGWFSLATYPGCPAQPLLESPCSNPRYPRSAGFQLTAGLLNGQSREVEQSFPKIIDPSQTDRAFAVAAMVGPNQLVYAFYDGTASELHRYDISSGQDERLASLEQPIYQIAADRVSGRVYLSLVEPKTRHDDGIWVLDQAGLRRLIPPRDDLAFDLTMNPWERSLYVSSDGTWLAVVDCARRVCELTSYLAANGQMQRQLGQLSQGLIYGVTTDEIVGDFACASNVCMTKAIRLDNGADRTIEIECGLLGTTGTDVSGAPIAIFMMRDGAGCDGAARIVEWDPATGSITRLGKAPETGIESAGPPLRSNGLGYVLPDGWVLLGPGGQLRPGASEPPPTLLRLSDSTSVPLSGLNSQ